MSLSHKGNASVPKWSNPLESLGQRFGRLVVIQVMPGKNGKRSTALCRCDCGIEKIFYLTRLRIGKHRSCGCLHRENLTKSNTKHGQSKSKLYRTWNSMRHRCRNPKHPQYKNYGARGITVCDRWANSIQAFIDDMGEKPTPQHTLERIDNEKGYELGNCRWATQSEQNRNQRRNHLIEINSETKCLIEWAEFAGIRKNTLVSRIRLGWKGKDLLAPAKPRKAK